MMAQTSQRYTLQLIEARDQNEREKQEALERLRAELEICKMQLGFVIARHSAQNRTYVVLGVAKPKKQQIVTKLLERQAQRNHRHCYRCGK